MQAIAYRVSAGLGLVAVALGAFGAHGLKEVLTHWGTTAIWQTAVLYHLVHAVALLALASTNSVWKRGPWICILVGILIFSGSLYILAVTGIRWLGAVTPLGGVSFLVGWGWLMWSGPPNSSGKVGAV
ncbi:MAG: DUF423 domain-containing protein [Verrucomicrobiales bacterium]|nr:DUF423 domain-containing protein [Verrucomicrobiales bacterium]